MSEQPSPPDARRLPGRDPSPAEVIDYLKRHPNFLVEHPDLAQILAPPARVDGDGVADLQKFMLERLRAEVARLKVSQRKLIQAGRGNLATQSRIHAAALALLGAESFQNLIDVVTTDLAVLLDVDAVALCVEATGRTPDDLRGIQLKVLPSGAVDTVMGEGQDVVLRSECAGDARIFGAAAGLVRSDALVRLTFGSSAPVAMIAFGSRRVRAFHPSQGTELLSFLARVLESCVRAWLDLPE
jgi:uncharacterized protein YigA (DUF484 family)